MLRLCPTLVLLVLLCAPGATAWTQPDPEGDVGADMGAAGGSGEPAWLDLVGLHQEVDENGTLVALVNVTSFEDALGYHIFTWRFDVANTSYFAAASGLWTPTGFSPGGIVWANGTMVGNATFDLANGTIRFTVLPGEADLADGAVLSRIEVATTPGAPAGPYVVASEDVDADRLVPTLDPFNFTYMVPRPPPPPPPPPATPPAVTPAPPTPTETAPTPTTVATPPPSASPTLPHPLQTKPEEETAGPGPAWLIAGSLWLASRRRRRR